MLAETYDMWKPAKKGGIGIYSENKPRAFDDQTNVEFL